MALPCGCSLLRATPADVHDPRVRRAVERIATARRPFEPSAVQHAHHAALVVNARNLSAETLMGKPFPGLHILEKKNYFSPPASGSFRHDGMVIGPCSMGTAARIANGISDDLVTRSADVTIKEARKLIIVPRESPMSAIHLKNQLTLAQCGVVMIPPVLTFYLKAFHSLDGQIDYTIGKVLDHLGLEHDLHPRWGE